MRQTTFHKHILTLLNSSQAPLSVSEILEKVPANKTTIYRQLNSLIQHRLVQATRFTDRKVRYEPANRTHHHHLVCTKCDQVSDISLPLELVPSAQQVASRNRFLIQDHYLEFFGLCQNCH